MKKIKYILFLIMLMILNTTIINAVSVGYNFVLNNTLSSEYGGDAYPGKHVVKYNNGFITVYGDGMGCAMDGTTSVDGGCSESVVEFKFYPNNGYEAKMNIDNVNVLITNNSYSLKYTEKGNKNINISFVKKEEPVVQQPAPEQPKEEPQIVPSTPKTEENKKEENKKEENKKEETTQKEQKQETKETTNLKKDIIEFNSATPINSNYKLDYQDITNEYNNENINDNYKIYKIYDINIKENNKNVKMENGNYTIKIKLPDELKEIKNLIIVYINQDTIEEMETEVIDEYIQFKTTHLSEYAIVEKIEEKETKEEVTQEVQEPKEEKKNNKLYIIIASISVLIIGVITVVCIIKTKSKRK